MRSSRRALLLTALAVIGACAEPEPTKGTYTVQFPSTEAAVATDYVQLFVFDVEGDPAKYCDQLIATRIKTPGSLAPKIPPEPSANICEMLAGIKPVTIPYGEYALLAVGQRRNADGRAEDFMIGCAIMTIGAGDAPKSIQMRPVVENVPLPATTCASVGDFCSRKCQ